MPDDETRCCVSLMVDRVFCRCDDRAAASLFQGFRFEAPRKGWVFPLDPPRSVSNPWRAGHYGTESHAGEPYTYIVCPFCGNDLPFVDPDPPPPAEFCGGEE